MHPAEATVEALTDAEQTSDLGSRRLGERCHHLGERLDGENAESAVTPVRRGVGGESFGEWDAADTAQLGQQEGRADEHRERQGDGGAAHDANTRSGRGSRMTLPAHTQHPAIIASATSTTTWPIEVW